jgi:N-acetylglutamate synthase-like GNAT family acetyltransferase
MSRRASSVPLPQEDFGEKEFYLDEFRARTLCFAVSVVECDRRGGFETLGGVIRDLLANGTRVIVLIAVPESVNQTAELRRIRRRLQSHLTIEETAPLLSGARGRARPGDSFADLTGDCPSTGALGKKLEIVWHTLRSRRLLVGIVEQAASIMFAQRLGSRLRVRKLVFIEPQGGLCSASGEQISFMDDTTLTTLLRTGQAEWSGMAQRRLVLESVRTALRGGVHSVNLCTMKGLPRELYTYEGSGTLFTLEDYCRVERLGIDDFGEVEQLISRGQREGVLKTRCPAEIARLLLNGYGATIGAGHLAGVCGLETEPYEDEKVGEIVGLYTVTRFKGEGVGTKLVARVLADAREAGLRYVFACTTAPRAAAFFERQGFRLVTTDDVPPKKWEEYDRQRLPALKVCRRDL